MPPVLQWPNSIAASSSVMIESVPNYGEVAVGDRLPPLTPPPITRQILAVYCGASGDHNPVHVDLDFARAAGLDDVIALA